MKITGYPSLRRILNGTRYRINHPKVLEVGIGSAGFRNGIMSGPDSASGFPHAGGSLSWCLNPNMTLPHCWET